jgi:DNA-binding response OmpR family regulator
VPISSVGYVLLVDDDALILRLLRVILSAEGYRVETAENGIEALALIGERLPALVLMDLNMAPMDGEAFHRRAVTAGYKGSFVVVSADIGGRVRSARLGAVYIQKPFDPDHLTATVADLLLPVAPH